LTNTRRFATLHAGLEITESIMLLRAATALLFSTLLSFSALAEGQRVILVLDASGSMRAKINGKTKMDIAKETVASVLNSWKPEDDLGLVVYGHREKSSCADIETIMPPRPLSVGEFMSPIKALEPKGKTPMTDAVRKAAEALKYTEQKGTVILVSDGVENCEADPCAVARELEKAGVGLTVHTVGFGLDDKTAVAQLKCMAEETGGIAVLADNADELQSAFKQTVEAKVEEPPPPPAQPVVTQDLTGHVIMAEGYELPKPFDAPVWVFSQMVNGAEGEYISTEYGKDLKADMTKSGDLMATVSSDFAKVVVPFKHEDGKPTDVLVNMNSGIMKFAGMLDEGTSLPNDGPSWVFSKADGTYYATGYGNAPTHLFNAGDYTLKLSMGSAAVEAAFSVAPGQTKDMVVLLGAGMARVTGTYSQGGETLPDGTAFEMRKPAGIDGKKEWIATEYGPDKVFNVPSGEYVLVAVLDLATAELPIKVLAGKEVAASINLNAGFISVTAPAAARIEVRSGEKTLDGKRKWLATDYGGTMNKAANAGTYNITAFGADDAVIGEKDVTVEAGKRAEITLP
jgi:Ca-activated chloride channel homolog